MRLSNNSNNAVVSKVSMKSMKKSKTNYFRNNYDLYLMLIPAVAFYLIFKYGPMYGVVIAFQDYNLFTGVLHSKWVGLEVFKQVLSEKTFWRSFFSTLELNFISLIAGFHAPIIVALLLNEITNNKFKRVVQSISYMPHFISWVIVYGMMVTFTLPDTGLFNVILKYLGFQQIHFLTSIPWWIAMFVGAGIWKEVGWGAIIYLSALSSIDPSLYESADIDGAGRFSKMWNVTLPGIKSTVVIMMILSIGKIVSIGFEQPYLMGNALVSDISNVLSVYIYKNGVEQSQWSFTTAIGLCLSIVNFAMLLFANFVSTRLGEEGLFGGKH